MTDTRIEHEVIGDGLSGRAAESFGDTSLPSSLKIYAWSTADHKPFILGDELRNSGGTWSTSSMRFWPQESLDFYGYRDAGGIMAYDTDHPVLKGIEIKPSAKDQLDFVVGSSPGLTMQKVQYMLKHATCQVLFQAKCDNPTLYVEIHDIKIREIAMKGDFHFGNGTSKAGTWNAYAERGDAALGLSSPIVLKGASETASAISHDINSTFQLMPQKTKAWSRTKGEADGAYISASVVLYNISGNKDNFSKDNELPVWGSDGHPLSIAVPLEVNWEPGKRYIYTLLFSKTAFSGDPQEETTDMVPILYGVSVEGYEQEINSEIETWFGEGGAITPETPSGGGDTLFGYTWAQSTARSWVDEPTTIPLGTSPRLLTYIPGSSLSSQGLELTNGREEDLASNTSAFHYQWNRNFGFASSTNSYDAGKLITLPNHDLQTDPICCYLNTKDQRNLEYALTNFNKFITANKTADLPNWRVGTEPQPSAWQQSSNGTILPSTYTIPSFTELLMLTPAGGNGIYNVSSTPINVESKLLQPFHSRTDGGSTYFWSVSTDSEGQRGIDIRKVSGTYSTGDASSSLLGSASARLTLPADGHRVEGVDDAGGTGYFWSASKADDDHANAIWFELSDTRATFHTGSLPMKYGCSLLLRKQ